MNVLEIVLMISCWVLLGSSYWGTDVRDMRALPFHVLMLAGGAACLAGLWADVRHVGRAPFITAMMAVTSFAAILAAAIQSGETDSRKKWVVTGLAMSIATTTLMRLVH